MTLKQRYQQAAKEASPKETQGPIGFPLWFELSCIYLPILFIVIGHWIIKIIYQDISLEIKDEENQK
ncbi:MAG: DUF997 family protein [Haemophilus haemolyticus]|nr:DUF997 family protein [Haemophilus haemolyticus]